MSMWNGIQNRLLTALAVAKVRITRPWKNAWPIVKPTNLGTEKVTMQPRERENAHTHWEKRGFRV